MLRHWLWLSCLVPALAYGQAQVNSGDVKGTVVDALGGLVAGVTVTASDPDRAIKRVAKTDSAGEYALPMLPPGVYRLRFEAAGFATKVVEGLEVRVGDHVVLPTEMAVSAMAIEVDVVAEASVIEPQRTQQASTIESVRIRNLPINRRNYLDFALLTPAVVETNDMVDGTDYRVVQTPQSGLSFGGGNGRGNAFTIDGVENYYNSGGVRPSISQEAVQEFQINRNSFSAEIGGALGGAVNIVSKSGTNQFHGNVFGFLRQRDIQARNYFDPGKAAFTRVQSGATTGGPIVRDKSYFFAALERLDRHETAFVPIYQDRSAFTRLTPSQQQLVDFFLASNSPQLVGLARAMQAALLPSPRTLELFDKNSGNFPFSEGDTHFSLRLDQRLSQRHSFFFRGNLSKNFSENAQFGALLAFNRGRSLEMLDGTTMASHSYVVNPQWVIETRAAFAYNRLDVIPTDPYGPGIDISGYGLFGREIFLPSTTFDRHWQLQQVWNSHRSKHDLKFGFDINPVKDVARSETFFAGRFSFGSKVPLGLILNSVMKDPNFATNLGGTLAGLGQQRLIPNLQAPLTALQSFTLGLPEFYQQGFGDPNWSGWSKRYNLFLQEAWRVLPRLTLNLGVRYELEANSQPVGTDLEQPRAPVRVCLDTHCQRQDGGAGRVRPVLLADQSPGGQHRGYAGGKADRADLHFAARNSGAEQPPHRPAADFGRRLPDPAGAGHSGPALDYDRGSGAVQSAAFDVCPGVSSVRDRAGLRESLRAPGQPGDRTRAGVVGTVGGLQLQPRRAPGQDSGSQSVLHSATAGRDAHLRLLQSFAVAAEHLRIDRQLVLSRHGGAGVQAVQPAFCLEHALHLEQGDG